MRTFCRALLPAPLIFRKNTNKHLLFHSGKELKRVTLLELVDYVNSAGGQKVRRSCCCLGCAAGTVAYTGHMLQIFTDTVIPDIIRMISMNMFRALPPQNEEFDPDEDEPSLEPSWPHLQVSE